jgi:hypothetical protein
MQKTRMAKQITKKNARSKIIGRFQREATMGIEPMVRVLQTLALPLGDVAIETNG